MSNSPPYSLIDDDHIDESDQINVGNLIINLESDIEREQNVNDQTNHIANSGTHTKCNASNSTNAPSSTSQLTKPSSSNSNNKTINKAQSNNLDSSKLTSKTQQKQHIGKDNPASVNFRNSGTISNNGHTLTGRTVFKSSADERGELKMKITRETKTGANEHMIVSSPTQKSPTSSSGGASGAGGNITININDNNTDRSNANMLGCKSKQSGISSTKECGTSTSIGTITEPECLGPCEPGTSVSLEGIVWQETDGGILVVNVTWRGKTYVGALLDCTRHDWAPPRLCDSPASDIDAKVSKGVRPKRIVTRSNGIGLDEKNLLQTTGKLRNGKGRRIPTANDPSCSKRQRETTDKPSTETTSAQSEANTPQANMSSTNSETTCVPMNIDASSANNNNNIDSQELAQESSNISIEKTGPNSPLLIGCNEPNCSKKYRNMNGLIYHQSHAHSSEQEPGNDPSGGTAAVETDQEPQASPPDDRNPSSPTQPESQNQPSPPSVPLPQASSKSVDSESTRIPSPNNRDDSSATRHAETERKPQSGYANVPNAPDVIFKSTNPNQKNHDAMNHSSSSSSSSRAQLIPTSKSSSQITKQPPINSAEEGMKPSGTSTGPPPAPHQANCYFNSAFLANTFNPYSIPPYFPRHIFDHMTPPPIPTSSAASNAALLSRFMNNMRNPPPPDSPSRLLSPSMPKNIPYPPFKIDPGVLPGPPQQQLHPHQIPTSIPLPNLPPITNPSLPPIAVPPMPPMPGGQPNMRMPSHGDSMLTPTSQSHFLPPAGLNPALGIPNMGNPLAPMNLPNLIDDQLAKQFPRRLN